MTAPLAAFMGCDRSSRRRIAHRIRQYIRTNHLKRRKGAGKEVRCDEVLRGIFQKKSFAYDQLDQQIENVVFDLRNPQSAFERLSAEEREAARAKDRERKRHRSAEAVLRASLRAARRLRSVQRAEEDKRQGEALYP